MKTTTLYRPVNDKELSLIKEMNFSGFPPRLADQPIFYPVMNEEYATQITKDWNVSTYGVGYVTRFAVVTEFLSKYPVQNVGATLHDELWIPAEDLADMNRNIVGKVEVIAEFRA